MKCCYPFSVNQVHNIFELIKPQKFFTDERDLDNYIKESGSVLRKLIKELGFSKGSIGYTLFIPEDIMFTDGKWGDYSPVVMWGLNNKEINNMIFASLCYYIDSLWYHIEWKDVPPYTTLWVEKLSSYIHLNIQLTYDNEIKENFQVKIEDSWELIKIKYNSKVFNILTDCLNKIFKFLEEKVGKHLEDIKKELEYNTQENCYNFRRGSKIVKRFRLTSEELTTELKECLDKLKGLSEKLSEELSEKLSEELSKKNISSSFKLTDIDKNIKNLPKILIKLLMIGPSPPVFMRLLNPKQYKVSIKKNGTRYIGCFAGLLRIFKNSSGLEKKELDDLEKFYPIALSLLSNIAFRVNTFYLDRFRKIYALRSAVTAIMTHAFAHDVGSHGLIHIAEDLIKDNDNISNNDLSNLSNFIKYLYSKSGFWAQLGDIRGNAVNGDIIYIKEIRSNMKTQAYELFKHLLRSECQNGEHHKLSLRVIFEYKDTDLIWLPWGYNMGFQALSTIVETVIRNLKHYFRGSDIQENKNEKQKIINNRLKECREQEIKIYITFEDEEPYYKVTIWDGKTLKSEKTWKEINDLLKYPKVMDPETTQPFKKGLSEMFICCSILRGCDYLNISHPMTPALLSLDTQNKKQLKYIFYVWKGLETISEERAISDFLENIKVGKDIPYRIKFVLVKSKENYDKISRIRKGILINNGSIKKKDNDIWYCLPSEDIHNSWIKYWLKIKEIEYNVIDSRIEVTVSYKDSKKETLSLSHRKCNNATLWYCSISNIGEFLDKIRRSDKSQKNLKIIYSVVECLKTPIVIIDERAYKKIKTFKRNRKMDVFNLLRNMELYIEYPKSFEELNGIFNKLKDIPVKFIIIHSSLWEDLCKNEKEKYVDRLIDLTDNFESRPYLFITTGKSKPTWMETLRRGYSQKTFFISWYDIQIALDTQEGFIDDGTNDRLFIIKRNLLEMLINR